MTLTQNPDGWSPDRGLCEGGDGPTIQVEWLALDGSSPRRRRWSVVVGLVGLRPLRALREGGGGPQSATSLDFSSCG